MGVRRKGGIIMACRHARQNSGSSAQSNGTAQMGTTETKLYFGVDSAVASTEKLQNNLDEFEWVERNKLYPNFWGRAINGENSITKEEIGFLHEKGCKIAAIYTENSGKATEEQGKETAKRMTIRAIELDIPAGTALFLAVDENDEMTRNYMRGYAETIVASGYIPGFMANTDAKYPFDRELSRGMQTDREIFEKCLVWATAPTFAEYERVTTTHLIHPDNWKPYAPSGITRSQIAIWRYGKSCHPIHSDSDREVIFNVDLIKNVKIIIEMMF